MLPTFVIGLREGLEAALIVGIIAAFLRQQGRRDLLRWVYGGVASAVLLCCAVGIGLKVLSSNLPQRQQEGLETVVGILAVCMVTYMVIWMRRHSRALKSQLEGLAAAAIGQGDSRAARAMVLMAFLAVLREGFETVVFLLAAFNETGNTPAAASGAVAGILLAVLLGYGIYRGGVRLNLSKFFRITGLVLVLVAAGLVVNALHTAHEAGWLNLGQGSTVDLTWLVQPGSVRSALLTGMLGIQDHPVVIEVIGWLVYLIPVGLYVAWPPGRAVPTRTLRTVAAGLAALGAIGAVTLALVAPSRPGTDPATTAGSLSAQLVGSPSQSATMRTGVLSPAAKSGASAATSPTTTITLQLTGSAVRNGITTNLYTAAQTGSGASGRPTQLTYTQVAAINGGRLPLGVRPQTGAADDATASVHVSYADSDVLSAWVEPSTGRVVDLSWTETVRASLTGTQVGTVPLDSPVATATRALPPAASAAAADAARHDLSLLARHSDLLAGAWACAIAAVVALLAALAISLPGRRSNRARAVAAVTLTPPSPESLS